MWSESQSIQDIVKMKKLKYIFIGSESEEETTRILN